MARATSTATERASRKVPLKAINGSRWSRYTGASLPKILTMTKTPARPARSFCLRRTLWTALSITTTEMNAMLTAKKSTPTTTNIPKCAPFLTGLIIKKSLNLRLKQQTPTIRATAFCKMPLRRRGKIRYWKQPLTTASAPHFLPPIPYPIPETITSM